MGKRLAVSTFVICLCLGALAQEGVIGDWIVVQETDPMTDKTHSIMAAPSWDNLSHAQGMLVFRCSFDWFEAVFASNLGGDGLLEPGTFTTATFRIDRGEIRFVDGATSAGGEIFFFDYIDTLTLVSNLVGAGNFVFSTESEGRRLTYQNRVSGFAEAYRYAGFIGLNGCPGAPTLP